MTDEPVPANAIQEGADQIPWLPGWIEEAAAAAVACPEAVVPEDRDVNDEGAS